MNEADLLIQIKECIEKSREQANPEKDKLFLSALEKLERRIDIQSKNLDSKETKYAGN